MKLVGSRVSGEVDEFSDYDYGVESQVDLAAVQSVLENFILWKCYRNGRLAVLTGVDKEGRMYDYSGLADLDWPQSAAGGMDLILAEFWVLSFKHLKALYRGHLLLADLGLEMSCGLARDLFVSGLAGTTEYKSFFVYKGLGIDGAPGLQELFEVTGLPCRTRHERMVKLRALNAFVDRIGHPRYPLALEIWTGRSALVGT